MSASTTESEVTLGQFSCILVSLYVLEGCDMQTLQHPFYLVQASWAPCGGLGGWFHSRATDVAAPIAGLIGIGYVALY